MDFWLHLLSILTTLNIIHSTYLLACWHLIVPKYIHIILNVFSSFGSTTVDINGGIKGGPLALFNEAGKAAVISPYNNFMAASLWHQGEQGGKLAWGIMGGVNDIPANFTYSTLLVFHDGINQVCTNIRVSLSVSRWYPDICTLTYFALSNTF